jgi:hypothetical protein
VHGLRHSRGAALHARAGRAAAAAARLCAQRAGHPEVAPRAGRGRLGLNRAPARTGDMPGVLCCGASFQAGEPGNA